jgi:drug/metabolite transporter (DMT)-like permease
MARNRRRPPDRRLERGRNISAVFIAWVSVAFFSAACWGAVVVLNKRVLEYVRPLAVNIIVLGSAVVTLTLVAVPLTLLRLWPLGFGLNLDAAGLIALGSTVTWLIAFNAYYFALRSGKIGVVGPISGTDPLFTALFATILAGAAIGRLTVAGLALATLGVALLSRSLGDEPEPHAPVLEGAPQTIVPASAATVVLLSLLTAAGWGFGPVMIQLAEESVGGASTTMIVLGEAFGVILLLPFVRWRRPWVFERPVERREVHAALWLMIVAGALNALFAVLFYLLIEHIGAVLTTLIVATSPVFAILGGVIFLRERFGARLGLAAAVTFVGVCLAIVDGAT